MKAPADDEDVSGTNQLDNRKSEGVVIGRWTRQRSRLVQLVSSQFSELIPNPLAAAKPRPYAALRNYDAVMLNMKLR
jgi:hypothetical protein